MTRRLIQATLGFTLAMAASASAGPVLLGSVHVTSGLGSDSPPDDNIVQFSFHVADGPEYLPPGIGQGVFWGDGASGIMDFDASNAPAFPFVAAQLTDGYDDSVYFLAGVPGSGGGGGGKEESFLFGRNVLDPLAPPDLMGFEIDFLRLTVDSVIFDRVEVEPGIFIDMTYDITWEIYGNQIIPEPGTLVLLFSLGLLVFLHKENKQKRMGRSSFVRFGPMAGVAMALPLLNLTATFGDFQSYNSTTISLWLTGNSCPIYCPPSEMRTSVSLPVPDLSPATGSVQIVLYPFADFSDNVDSGNGYGFYDVYIGGTRMTSSVAGHVSGAPSDGQFRKFNGTLPPNCCFHTGNSATIVVTDAFFNSKLGAAGAEPNELRVEIRLPGNANVPCAAVGSGCATNMDAGFHRAEITWCDALNPPDCNDNNPCTTDGCVAGVCANVNNSNTCADESPPNPCTNDVCVGGVCTHPLRPVGSACGSNIDTQCDNPDRCNGSGVCLVNNEPADTPCGDPSNTACDNPDSCNGAGGCLDNWEANGTSCADAFFCNGAEQCQNSVCPAASPACGTQPCCEANDSCGLPCAPVAAAPSPHDRRKNRYISFTPNNDGATVAFRVRKLPLAAGSGFCTVTSAACTGASAAPNFVQGSCGAGQVCVAPYGIAPGSPAGSCGVDTPQLNRFGSRRLMG